MKCLDRALFLLFSFLLPSTFLLGQQEKQVILIDGEEMQYLLYLPKDYEKGIKHWPLLLFLHGSGERGNDIELVKKHGPPKLIEMGKEFDFIVVSPQCPPDQRWSPETLSCLLEHLDRNFAIDTGRIYVTGLSMGGQGTWNLALAYPDRFAAIAPVCGRVDTTGACSIRDLPVWVFHGALDDVVPVGVSENMARKLKQCGNDVRLTIYPNAGHDSWTETYNNPRLYRWLSRNKR